MPHLPAASAKTDVIGIGIGAGGTGEAGEEIIFAAGGKWEDEEERRFYEDIQDLKDFVPKAVLGLEEVEKTVDSNEVDEQTAKDKQNEEKERLDEEMKKVEAELQGLAVNGTDASDPLATNGTDEGDEEYVRYLAYVLVHLLLILLASVPTPTPGTPKEATPSSSPLVAPQGPSQMLTALLVRLPECTNRAMIDQAAVDFAFLNSKAGRKRLVKVRTASALPRWHT
jgi:regulator of nonsense transcripts 2